MRRWRAVSQGPEGVHTRLAVSASDLRLSPVALVGVPPATATASGADDSSRRRRHGGVPVCLALGGAATPELAVRGPPAEAEKSARRRRRVLAEDSPDALGERSPAPATAGCRLVVSVTGQRQWHCCGARETAQALQHGCGEDCWRSASLHCATRATASAALSAVANASSTSLAYKACV